MQESPGLKPDLSAATDLFAIKNGNISSKISLSRIFLKLAEVNRADNFYKFVYLPFLKIGTILPFFHSKGNAPVLKYSSKIFHNGLQIAIYLFIAIYQSALIGKVRVEKFCFLFKINFKCIMV